MQSPHATVVDLMPSGDEAEKQDDDMSEIELSSRGSDSGSPLDQTLEVSGAEMSDVAPTLRELSGMASLMAAQREQEARAEPPNVRASSENESQFGTASASFSLAEQETVSSTLSRVASEANSVTFRRRNREADSSTFTRSRRSNDTSSTLTRSVKDEEASTLSRTRRETIYSTFDRADLDAASASPSRASREVDSSTFSRGTADRMSSPSPSQMDPSGHGAKHSLREQGAISPMTTQMEIGMGVTRNCHSPAR